MRAASATTPDLATTENDAGLTRHTDFPNAPSLLHVTFDLGVSAWTVAPSAVALAFGVLYLVLAWLTVQLALGDRPDKVSGKGALHQMVEQIPHRPRNGLWLQGLALTSLVAAELDDGRVGRRRAGGRGARDQG